MRPTSPQRAGLPCLHEFFSTGGAEPGERFEFWRDTCVKRYEPFGSVGEESHPFAASVRNLIAPEGEFTELHMTPAGITRTQRRCAADAIDHIILSLTLNGGGGGWFGEPDRTTTLDSGPMRIRNQARPYVVQWTGADNHTLHVELPRARFDRATLVRVLAAAGRPLPMQGLVPLLAGQMRSLAAITPDLDPPARAGGLSAVLELAATMLRLEFGSASADSEVCEDGMLVAAQALICRRFASADLSPAEIARRLGCSRAHLYRVFARHGTTVAGYLREVRLERCRAALAAAGPRDSVSDIAFRSGFDNPVHFAHVFRSRFGMRPSEARRRGRQPPAA